MLKKKILLEFNNNFSFTEKGKHVRDGLSSALRTGNNLWTCCDERSSVERLTLTEDGRFAQHKHFDLSKYLTLPAEVDCEIDIEGLGIDQNQYLWIVGSHSRARKKPRADDPPEKQIKRLAKVKDDPNRYLLARIPLVRDPITGDYEPVRSNDGGTGNSALMTAAQLIYTKSGNQLMDLLQDDDHFKAFMKIPGKDNGFDIEGMAVHKGRLFLGVRGPVLRGWAIIMEIEVSEVNEGWLELKADKDGNYYKKHFLHLEGMGIRDLRIIQDDLLILAGPTMDLDGTISVYRWRNALKQDKEAIVHRKELERLFDVPHGYGKTSGQDKAEGMALFDPEHVLIVYDSPTDSRKDGDSNVFADLYQIGEL